MSNRAGDLDTEKTGDAEEEAKDPSDQAAPDEHPWVPSATRVQIDQLPGLSMEEYEGEDHHRRASVRPPGELDRRVVAVGQRTLYQNSVDGDEECREDAIDQGDGGRDGFDWEIFGRCNTDHESDGDYS